MPLRWKCHSNERSVYNLVFAFGNDKLWTAVPQRTKVCMMKFSGLIFNVENLHEKKKSNTYSMEISRCCLKRLPQHRALDKESRTRGYSICCVRRTSYFDEVKLKISLSNQLFAVSPSVLFYAAALILFPLPHFSFITCYNSKFLMFKCSHRVTQSWGQ